jgi:hypothetical protein
MALRVYLGQEYFERFSASFAVRAGNARRWRFLYRYLLVYFAQIN